MLTKDLPGSLHFTIVSMPLINALRTILFDMIQTMLDDIG